MNHNFTFGFWIGLAAFVLLISSCAEQAGTGAQIGVPNVTINCTTAHCRTNTTAIAFVKVTQSSCDPAFDNWATTASSFQITCTAVSGCVSSPVSWVNGQGTSVTTLPSGIYTVCGRIDYNANYPNSTNDDTTTELENTAINHSSQSLTLSTWSDP